MYYRSVEIHQFRNFESVSATLDQGINIFVGNNGQGKTNFLEALYYVSKGKSFRTPKHVHLIRHLLDTEYPLSFLKVNAIQDPLSHFIEAHITEKSRKFFLNGKTANSQLLARTLPCVLFSPESLMAIKEGPEIRRELVDEITITNKLDYLRLLSDYSKYLRSRNQLLRQRLGGTIPDFEFKRVFDALNEGFIELAVKIVVERLEALRAINPLVGQITKSIVGDNNNTTFVDYLVSSESAYLWDETRIRDALYNKMHQVREAELAAGSTLVGPHRHDIKIYYDQKDSRYFCSQGQQRALILALKMSQIVHHHEIYGNFPALFLDDVLSELDGDKRQFLIDFLVGIKTQSLITTTDFSLFEGIDRNVSIFRVEDGKIEN